MKRITFKSVKLSLHRRRRSPTEEGTGIGDGESTSESNSPGAPESNTEVRKKEKIGLLKSFKRRLTTNLRRKSDDGHDSDHIEAHYMAVPSKRDSKRHKNKWKPPDHSSKSNSSSHSCDSLDLNITSNSFQKMCDIQSNTDAYDMNVKKDKASCRTKDMARFQVTDKIKADQLTKACVVKNGSVKEGNVCVEKVTLPYLEGRIEVARSPTFTDCDEERDAPKVWNLTQELFRLSKFGWYWGPITRVEAEDKLANQQNGAFLVRDSSDERYLLSLSFRSYGRTWHTRIEHCNGMFSFYAQPETEGYPSIVDLIEHSMNDSQTGIFCYSRSRSPGAPSFPVRLTKPVSRFTQVRSLQYLCRFVIRQYTRYDHIQQLPLPKKIKGWIEENQY